MDEKQRGVLERNQSLLLGNIVTTEEFFHLLKHENVLPDTMIKDIQAKKSQYERNVKLLETLRLRGGDCYRKFRHVLLVTGHSLLADHLYGEDVETKLLRADDVFGKFPKVFNHVSDDVKSKLLRYLETRVKERAVTNAWLMSAQERSEVLEAKKIHYDADKDYRIKLETKTRKISQMKAEIMELKDDMKRKDEEITQLQQEIADLQRNFKQELSKQTRFNAANNSSIIQLRDRFDNFNERVRLVNVAMRQFLDTEHHKDFEDDPENVKMSVLEKNVRKLIQIARANIETTSSSVSEKEAVLNLLRTSTRNKQCTLSEIVQQYVEKQERAKMALSRELETLLDIVRGPKHKPKITTKQKTDLKYIKTQMAMLREEVEHIKKKLEWKDAQITDLIKENNNILEKNSLPENKPPQNTASSYVNVTLPRLSTASVTRDSPDTFKDMEKAYQRFERWNAERPSSPPVRRGSLVDVNLERGRSPSPVRKRRNSKFDTTDLDLFGTQSHIRRSLTDLGYSHSQSLSSISSNSIDKIKLSPRPVLKCPDPDMEYVREGRRPSLAELITIYENAQDDITDNRLAVVHET